MVLVTCPGRSCASQIMVPPDASVVVCGVCGLQFPTVTQIPGSKATLHAAVKTPVKTRWDNTILGRSTPSAAAPIPTAAQVPALPVFAAAGLPLAPPTLAEAGWPARPGNSSMPPSYEQSEADIIHAAGVRPAPAAAAPVAAAPLSTGIAGYQPPPDAIEIELEQTGSLPLGLELAFIKAGASLTAVICHIQPGSIAAFTKQLQIGDMLEAINGVPVAELTKDEARSHLASSSVKLVLTRDH